MVIVLINPVAGNGRAKRIGQMVEQTLQTRGMPYRTCYTQHAGHAEQLAQQASSEGVEIVFAVGGDGTVRETALGLLHGNAALAVIPAGTGNDFAKTLGVPAHPQQALAHALDQPARRVDAGLINGRLFVNESGTGFEVKVLDYALQAKRFARGLLPYLYGVIVAIARFKPIQLTFTLEDGVQQCRAITTCTIANGRYIGGGIPAAPLADVHDGLLDVIVVSAKSRLGLLRLLPGLLRGKILSFPGVEYTRCRRVELHAPGMRMNVDGEILPMDHARIEIMPDALWVRA